MTDLETLGYVVVPRAIDAAHVDHLRRAFDDAPAQTDGTQHVPLFDEALASHAAIAAAAKVVFGSEHRVRDMPSSRLTPLRGAQPPVDAYRIDDMPSSRLTPLRGAQPPIDAYRIDTMHGRNPLPGYGQQGLHADWRPRSPGEPFQVMTAIWMLDDFTVENGATRVVPGSHRITTPLAKALAQPLAKHPDEKIITGRAGDVLVFNGHLWHSGRKNESRGPRRCVQMLTSAIEP